jgi:protein TonB
VAPRAEESPAGTPIRVGGEVREPRKTRHVNPEYPKDAIASRIQGVVILECTISPQGEVVAVKTLRGLPMLDEAAIEAVQQWEYSPTLLNGVAVPVIMTVTVNFKLS